MAPLPFELTQLAAGLFPFLNTASLLDSLWQLD